LWALGKNLRLNPTKTKVMIVIAKRNISPPTPEVVESAIVVDSMSILGVTITSDLCKILSSAASSMYAY